MKILKNRQSAVISVSIYAPALCAIGVALIHRPPLYNTNIFLTPSPLQVLRLGGCGVSLPPSLSMCVRRARVRVSCVVCMSVPCVQSLLCIHISSSLNISVAFCPT